MDFGERMAATLKRKVSASEANGIVMICKLQLSGYRDIIALLTHPPLLA
jgi:hypothetical protein